MSNPQTRKSCVVPKCVNTTTNAPEKLFFIVPSNAQMRKKWIKAMKRVDPFGAKSCVYCCADHFDIENDMENYVKYKLVGGRIKLKKGVVPHKFECQQQKDHKPERSAVWKRNQIRFSENLLFEDTIPSTSSTPTNTSSVQKGCEDCAENINACKFHTSLENSVTIKEFSSDITFVTCCRCKNSVKQTSAVPLQDYLYSEDVVKNLILKQVLKVPNTLQICETCQMSTSNLHTVLELLSNFCESETIGSQPLNVTNDNKINFKFKPVVAMCIVKEEETNNKVEPTVKEEVEEERHEVYDQEFQIKQEELDLKMEFEDEHSSSGVWNQDESEQFPLNNTLNCNREYQSKYQKEFKKHMLIHTNINDTKILRCDQCKFQTKHRVYLMRHMLVHKVIGETEIFKCDQCEFQTKYKCCLTRHCLIHKDVSEIEIFKCDQCEFYTKHKSSLKIHRLIHKGIFEAEIFRCDQCKFYTKNRYYLKKHILIHKENTLIHKGLNETEIFKCEYK